MGRREDYGSNTEADAGRFERFHSDRDYYDDRPTKAEAARDEADLGKD